MIINYLYLSYGGFHRPGPGRRFLNLFQRITTHFIVFYALFRAIRTPLSQSPAPAPLPNLRSSRSPAPQSSARLSHRASQSPGVPRRQIAHARQHFAGAARNQTACPSIQSPYQQTWKLSQFGTNSAPGRQKYMIRSYIRNTGNCG